MIMIDIFQVICILVVVAVSWEASEAVGPSSSQVRNPYSELFDHVEPVEDWKLMQMFLKMRENRFNDVDNVNFDSVKYWYDATVNFRPDHCKKDHWDELRDRFNRQTGESSGGLLLIAQKALIDFCSEYYIDLERILDRLVNDQLDRITRIYNNFEYWHKHGQSDWRHVWLARKVARVGLQSKKKFDLAWENGFCAKILNKLREPEMDEYSRFTHLVTQAGPYYFKYCTEPVRYWIKIVDMCQHLENAEKNYVNKRKQSRNLDSKIALATVLQSH